MGIFSRRKAIPVTSYGYMPPVEATACGWECSNLDCARTETEAVRKWPLLCTDCRSPADPLFDEPWSHDAEPIRLRWRIGRVDGYSRTLYQAQLLVWHYKDALMDSDESRLAEARQDARKFIAENVSESQYFIPGGVLYPFVHLSLQCLLFDEAVEDLLYWNSISVADEVESDNTQRTNVRQLLASCQSFLAHPGARLHPMRNEIVSTARMLAHQAQNVLTVSHIERMHLLEWLQNSSPPEKSGNGHEQAPHDQQEAAVT